MDALESLRAALPEAARDLKLNLQNVLHPGLLSPAQRWGTAVATAVASRHAGLTRAVVQAARREVDAAVVEDAFAAASLMAMNNVYYRFRHFAQTESYAQKPARLRMQRLARPATNKADLELFSLAVSAVHGCETCVRSHEQVVVVAGGLTDEHVHDAVRIAAVIHAAAVTLDGLASVFDDAHLPSTQATA
jgi:alkyl hydroperoxide reductase subunit D